MSDFTPELKRLLREAGCYFVRSGKGDHEIWFSPKVGRNGSAGLHWAANGALPVVTRTFENLNPLEAAVWIILRRHGLPADRRDARHPGQEESLSRLGAAMARWGA